MLLNYHIGRLVLSSLCVGDLVRLVLGGVRFAGWSLQNEHHPKPIIAMMHGPINIRFWYCVVSLVRCSLFPSRVGLRTYQHP